jgi:predicted RNA polymerase sigma factor
MLAHLMPRVAEIHGLLALLEIQASRFPARSGPDGRPVLLANQDRMRWDRLLIRRGLHALDQAVMLGGGPYTWQAAIAACHARAATYEHTDWHEVARLYDAYVDRHPSPVADVNRAVAHWKAHGGDAARRILRPLLGNPRLACYHLQHVVIADIESSDGNREAARVHLRTALTLTESAVDRAVIQAKLAVLGESTSDPSIAPGAIRE